MPAEPQMEPEVLPEICTGCEQEVSMVLQWLVDFVQELGYLGIFIMTFLESTVMPIPAEVTMVPAGYLIYQGQMHFWYVFIASILGTVCGSLVNYYIAMRFGRPLMLRFGKFFLLTEKKIDKLDRFFEKHGEISTFTGRLIPGLRHFISLPAGLTRMNVKKFCFYTALGGSIWMLVLIGVGYWIGGNEALLNQYLPRLIKASIVLAIAITAIYVYFSRRKAKRETG